MATCLIIQSKLSAEFTRWKQRVGAGNAASPGLKPGESLARLACSCQLSPHWHEASGSGNTGKYFIALPKGGRRIPARVTFHPSRLLGFHLLLQFSPSHFGRFQFGCDFGEFFVQLHRRDRFGGLHQLVIERSFLSV